MPKVRLHDQPLPKLRVFKQLGRASRFRFTEKKKVGDDTCLWPAPYNTFTVEAATAFVLNCRTWNEANQSVEKIPDMPYIRLCVALWFKCFETGRMFLMEKCRRMVLTWVMCALDLWIMGLKRSEGAIVGTKYDKSTGFVWRLQFMYRDLQKRYPEWRLGKDESIRFKGVKKLGQVSLPNGSVCFAWNQDPETFRSDGLTFCHLEELSTWKDCNSAVAQAQIVTKGKPGERGGFVYAINNASPNFAWKELKRFAS